MRKILIISVVIVLIVVIIGGYLGSTYLSSQNGNDNNTPEVLSLEQIRDRAMLYLMANHTSATPLMNDLSWSPPQETAIPGSKTFLYSSGNWSLSVHYPVVLNPIYTITANYSAPGCAPIQWIGTFQNGAIDEQHNDFTGTAYMTQEQIRDVTITFIKVFHNQTAPYMQGIMWAGGRMEMGMMVGSDKYNYQSSGWNMTMQNPVVPNPIYTITVSYNSPPYYQAAPPGMITWQGTMHNGTLTETRYAFNP